MKKIYLAIVASLLLLPFASKAEAQANIFEKGFNFWNVGIGFSDYYRSFPPLNVSYEYVLNDQLWDENSGFGVGAYVSQAGSKYYNAFFIGPRVGVHYNFVPQLDTYASLMLGYLSISSKSNISDAGPNFSSRESKLDWGLHIGARYYFTPTVGAYAELGYGLSYVNLGASFRF